MTRPTTSDSGLSCAECWELVLQAGRSGHAPGPEAVRHLERCPGCRESAERVGSLGRALSALSVQLEREARSRAAVLTDRHEAELLVRLARYESWNCWGRRAFTAGAALAAGLAIIFGVLFMSAPGRVKSSSRQMAFQQQVALADSREKPETGLKASPVVAAIPVEGWVDLPSREASPDSIVWWVVLNYGARL